MTGTRRVKTRIPPPSDCGRGSRSAELPCVLPESLRDTVQGTIREFRMFPPGEAILIGVSGGPDSVALLHILKAVMAGGLPRMGVAHLDHRLRPGSSERDAWFVEDLCREFGLPCHREAVDVRQFAENRRLSLEEAARICRYEFFDRIADSHRYRRIALAHHADDNAEQVLMALFRGAGPAGTIGIPAVRGRIVRPLIRVHRSDLTAYLERNRIPFVLDESNNDLRFTRNRIRHQILPWLQSVFHPGIVESLNRFSEILCRENEWMETVAAAHLDLCRVERGAGWIHLSSASIRELHPALARRVVRRAIREVKGDLRKISFFHVQSILDLADRAYGPSSVHLPDRIRVVCSKTAIRLEKSNESLRVPRRETLFDHERVFQTDIEVPKKDNPTIIDIPEVGSRLHLTVISRKEISPGDFNSPKIALLDMEALSFPLIVRQVREGDRFKPLGAPGSQKVHKFFVDHHVPARCRRTCPVLVSGERIVWVCGHRIDDDFKMKPTSTRILKVSFHRLALA